jgi:hypothetical protein
MLPSTTLLFVSLCRRNFKDELEDRTTPDQESEGITCTIRNGAVPMAAAAAAPRPYGRKMM